MATFATSTQVRRWVFTPANLASLRGQANSEALQRVRDQVNSQRKSGDTSNDDKKDEMAISPVKLPVVTPEEEQLITAYWHKKVADIVEALGWPSKVARVAQIYLKRCFIRHSIVDYDLKELCILLIYIAAKIQEAYISASKLANEFDIDEKALLKAEIKVMTDMLKFDFIVYTPHRSFEGFLEQLKHERMANYASVAATAQEAIERAMNGDIILLYSPGQIAFACLNYAAEVSSVPAHEWKSIWEKRFQGSDEFATVLKTAKDIWSQIEQSPRDLDIPQIQAVDRKLKQIRTGVSAASEESTPKRRRSSDQMDVGSEKRKLSRQDADDTDLLGSGETTGRGLDFSNM